jgi:TRAP-type uncharacterized transport system substrate-binding protein
MGSSSDEPAKQSAFGKCLHGRGVQAAVLLTLVLAATGAASAQTDRAAARLTAAQQQALRAKLNETTLLVATGAVSSGSASMVEAIGTVLAGAEGLRVVPVAGAGGPDTLRDLLFLRGMDLAIVPTNVLHHAKETESVVPAPQQRIAYITRLYGEEIHLLAGRDARTLQDLRGKRIAVAAGDGNARFTVGDLLQRVGIGISGEAVAMPATRAVDAVRAGEAAAVLLIGAKPLAHLSRLPKDGSLRLLDLPFSRELEEAYVPAVLRAEDYPSLIPPGVMVETLAVGAVLVTSEGRGTEASHRRVERFVPAFFGGLTERSAPHLDAKWREVNLAATLPGWTRFGAAQEWLDNAKQQQVEALERNFEDFLRASGTHGSAALSAARRKKLFEEFVEWTRKSVAEPGRSPGR